jgi:hypothetical protein
MVLLHGTATTDKAVAAPSASKALEVVKQCVAKANSVPAPAVLSAMLELEAAKLPVSGQKCGSRACTHACMRARLHTTL